MKIHGLKGVSIEAKVSRARSASTRSGATPMMTDRTLSDEREEFQKLKSKAHIINKL